MWHADQTLAQSSPPPPGASPERPDGRPPELTESAAAAAESESDSAPVPPPDRESVRQPWSGRKTAGVLAGAIAVAAAVAVAVSVTDFGSSGADGQAGFGPGGGPGFLNQLPAAASAATVAGALHGEFVVDDGNGGYLTRALQTGEVTAVDQDSLTVDSSDGYSRTYLVDDETLVDGGEADISDVEVGDDVTVTATVDSDSDADSDTDSDTATLDTVSDSDSSGAVQDGGQLPGGGQLPDGRQGPGGGQVPGQGTIPGQGGAPRGDQSGQQPPTGTGSATTGATIT